MKNVKLHRVSRLGLNNIKNKILSIKYISCSADDNFYYIKFSITSNGLATKTATLFFYEHNKVFANTSLVSKPIALSNNSTTSYNLKVKKSKIDNLNTNFEYGGFEFRAEITCDNLSHKTGDFNLRCSKYKKETPQKTIKELPLKEVLCTPLNLTEKQKVQFIAVVLSESSHGLNNLWDIAWIYFSRVSSMGFEKGMLGSTPYKTKNSNYRLWMYYLNYGNEYKDYNYQGNGKLSVYIKKNGWFTTKIIPRAKSCIKHIKDNVFSSKPKNKYKGWYGQGYYNDLNYNPSDKKGDQWYMTREYYLLQTENKVTKKYVQILEELNENGRIKDQTTFLFDVIKIEKYFKDNPKKLPKPENVKKYRYGEGKKFKR